MVKLSVVLATRNEASNIARCLDSVKEIADEIIIFDEHSTDDTAEIARSYGAKVFLEPHHDNFHITKQKAIDKAQGKWILQLDADEEVTSELAAEIADVVNMSDDQIISRELHDAYKRRLFKRHMQLITRINPDINTDKGPVVAFFIPRRNMFLGKPLIHAGVYPDPAIRLIRKGKAYLPGKSVHEIMKVSGRVSWLFNDMLHYDSPTLERYIMRLNRYTDLHAGDLKVAAVSKGVMGMINYLICKPLITFIRMFIRNRGYRDGAAGFVWCAFSSFHFPIAYFKYFTYRD